MSKVKHKGIKKTLIGATMLATAPVWAKTGDSGVKSPGNIGGNQLALIEIPGHNVNICYDEVGHTKSTGNLTANNITMAIPNTGINSQLLFQVRDVLTKGVEYTLFLASSSVLLAPEVNEIPTSNSIQPLRLPLDSLGILAIYHIPAQQMLTSTQTRLGKVSPDFTRSIITFGVDLNMNEIPTLIANNETIFVQAALLPTADFHANIFDNMILSEVDTLGFVNSCPGDSVNADDSGTKSSTDTKSTK